MTFNTFALKKPSGMLLTSMRFGSARMLIWSVLAMLPLAALTQDPAPEVQLQLAASLGEVPPPAADSAIVALLTRSSEQPYLVDATATSLNGRELALLRHLTQQEERNNQQAGYAQSFQTLAATIVNGSNADEIPDAAANKRSGQPAAVAAACPAGGNRRAHSQAARRCGTTAQAAGAASFLGVAGLPSKHAR